MTTILSLDLGTTTGWALCTTNVRKATTETSQDQVNDVIVSGTFTCKPGRYEGGGMRYLRMQRYLDELMELRGFEEVYFEEVRRHAGTDAAHVYGGFLATLTRWCEEQNIPYQGVPVGTIKKYITGKGNASKDAVIEAVRSLEYTPKDDNEADAIALALFVRGRETHGK